MDKIALIAGQGELPLIWAGKAREKGCRVYAFPVVEENTLDLQDIAEEVYPVNIGQLSGLIELILKYNIKKVVMLGKVRKGNLFSGVELDQEIRQMLSGLDDLNDDSILLAIVNKLHSAGVEVIEQSTFLEDLLARPGLIAGKQPSPDLRADMEFGFRLAREIGRLDIGQTVIVKNRAVLAVEAIEGTDQAIKRGGELGGRNTTTAKVSKPDQDFRFDLPTVGLKTVKNLIEIGARGLVIEAHKTFLLNREEIINKAEKHNITVMAFAEERG